MLLRLQVQWEDLSDTTHTLSRDVERPYPDVPRRGERVFLGESSDDPYLQHWSVMTVRWENDGVVTLGFRFDGRSYDPGPLSESLTKAGFSSPDDGQGPASETAAPRLDPVFPVSGISVAEDLLAQGEPWYDQGEVAGWSTSPAFLVFSRDTDGAAAALHAAGQRFYGVDDRGQDVDPERAAEENRYTPNWVSDVYLTDRGPAVYVDTKGELPRPMGERMIDIVVEELTARKVAARIDVPPPIGPSMRVWTPPAV